MKKIIALIAAIAFFATVVYAKQKVTLLMDWFPQGNQSGFWQAQFDNQYHDDLEIIIKSGGPSINTTAQVAAGSVEFGLQASDSVMLANSKGAKLKGIFVSLNHVPYTLVYHPNTGVNSVHDLDGRPFAVKIGVTYWKWVKQKYGLNKVKELSLIHI